MPIKKASPHASTETSTVSTMPLYRQLAQTLQQTMESGKLGPNTALPTERDLALTYNVSRDTVRKAIRLLEEQGVLYSDHGRGTFTAPEAVRQMSRSLGSFTEDTLKRGGTPGQKILLMENVAASMAISSLLQIEQQVPLLRIKRLRLMNGAPVGLQDSYLKLPPGAKLERKELERAGSLYRILIDKFGIDPSESLESVGAVAAVADDVTLLDVSLGTPLLVCERVMLSDRRDPIEYCEMKYVPSYRYKTRISK
ncbi:GntR family transcriptional regulator [Undibacterium sp. SXout7W]|uniref:GntR family transcriptional regulator n=1 Tax=Undibacterium sp. SXout7W TaxID=3413049 RepID=UPI003BF36F78